MRHLSPAAAVAALRRGRPVEQFLGPVNDSVVPAIRWVTVSPAEDGIEVGVHEVEDIGDADFVDVSEFPPIDEDEYIGEGRVLASVADPEAALGIAGERLGTNSSRWVNHSLVGDEYLDFKNGKTGV